MNAKEVMERVLQNEGISGLELCRRLGVGSDTIRSITSGKVKNISPKLAEGIVEIFPHYNKLWILTGDGEMILPEAKESSIETSMAKMMREQNMLFQKQLEVIQQQNRTMHEEFMAAIRILRELGIEIKSRFEDCEANEK